MTRPSPLPVPEDTDNVFDNVDEELNRQVDYRKARWFTNLWIDSRDLVETLGDIPEHLVPFNHMMESLAVMFCCLMPCGVVESFYAMSQRVRHTISGFTNDFITIVATSSQPGR